MRADELSRFERAVLEWIREHVPCSELAMQLSSLRLVGREWTKCGCYTQLEVASDAPSVPLAVLPERVISGPLVNSAAIEWNGGTLLWLDDGRVTLLETYANGYVFPEDHDDLDPFTFDDPPVRTEAPPH